MVGVGFVLQGRYQFVAELGRGGTSSVFLARDLNLHSYWAVKKVTRRDDEAFRAFKKETELLASLSHPDIPRIVDRIELGEDFYVVMDFVDGTSLGRLVKARGPQSEEKVVEWSKMLCDVLEYLHTVRKNPIVYRDMKPDNVMLTQAGRIKLIDFGIARECPPGRAYTGKCLGTKGYAAPEQYRGSSNILDERTDIYSLGATLFFLATGQVPEMPPDGVPAIRSIAPQMSEGFEYVIERCTRDNPEERYQSIADVRADLDDIGHLTRSYRRRIQQKIGTFFACIGLSCIFALTGLVGYRGMSADREDTYQAAFAAGMNAGREGDYAGAASYYAHAIDAKPGDTQAYLLYFDALLPREGGAATLQQTREAIDEFGRRYVDNSQSAMYHNPVLMYEMVRRCIEVQDAQYAARALTYIELIEASRAYQQGDFKARELPYYQAIASCLAQSAQDADFVRLQQSVDGLESYADSSDLTSDERLSNYYILILVYSTYPAGLDNAYDRAYEIGNKARALLQSNREDEDLRFNNILSMYELVASGQYASADYYSDDARKETAYRRSLEWFGYLNEMDAPFSEALGLREANAHKAIFDLYNRPSRLSGMNDEIVGHLEAAIAGYERLAAQYPNSLLPQVYLASAYLDQQLLLPEGSRDFSRVMTCYARIQELRASQKELSQTELMQISALLEKMRLAGLEV